MVKNMYNYTFLHTAKRYFLLINKTFLYFKQKGFLFGSLLNIRIFLMNLLVSSLIVGFVVYAAGMIGFVGLIIPHIIRMLVGTDHKKLVPISALAGAIFLVLADGLCRIIIPKTELPIGILISLIGAPCFVYLMIKKTYGFGGN